jgi:hypothetical protein
MLCCACNIDISGTGVPVVSYLRCFLQDAMMYFSSDDVLYSLYAMIIRIGERKCFNVSRFRKGIKSKPHIDFDKT